MTMKGRALLDRNLLQYGAILVEILQLDLGLLEGLILAQRYQLHYILILLCNKLERVMWSANNIYNI